jgi:hypothetical protein
MSMLANIIIMPRLPRLVIPGYPHHVTQRGNHRQNIFFSDEDHSGLLDMDLWRKHFDPCTWREYLNQVALRTDINDRIRKATTAERFCGPEDIAKEIERKYRRPIKGKAKPLPAKAGRLLYD